MMLVPLSRLLPAGRADEAPVALRDGALLSFAQFRADIARAAGRIEAAGIKRGLLVAKDSYLFAAGLFALLHSGADVILPPNTQPGSLRTALGDADALVTDDASAGGLLLTAGARVDGDPLRPIDEDRSRIKFYTSGSTGGRKAVDKSLGQLEREIAVLETLFGATLGAARIHGTVSHQHIYGLTFRVLWPLMAGRVFIAHEHHLWESLLAELAPPAAIISSPAHLSRLGALTPLAPGRRPALIATAGAPLSWQAAEECLTLFGRQPTEIFGSTETGAIAHRIRQTPDAPWQLLPGVEAIAEETGELTVRSPFTNGRIRTADRVEFIDKDRFHFNGRSDRIIKIEGKRVSMLEVEQHLARLPWLGDVSVLPLTEGRVFLGAVATLTEDGRVALAEVGKFRFERAIRRELAATQDEAALPRRWRFVDEIPADAMGKHPRALLEALFDPSDHG